MYTCKSCECCLCFPRQRGTRSSFISTHPARQCLACGKVSHHLEQLSLPCKPTARASWESALFSSGILISRGPLALWPQDLGGQFWTHGNQIKPNPWRDSVTGTVDDLCCWKTSWSKAVVYEYGANISDFWQVPVTRFILRGQLQSAVDSQKCQMNFRNVYSSKR